ncbi:hypothetical protein D3C72_1371100 [compost metagenome]
MLVRGDAKTDDLAKVDGAQGQDVGDGEAISCHIGHLGETGIEPGKPCQGLLLALLPPLGEDGLAILVKAGDVAKRHAGGQPEIEFDDTAPHLYGGTLQRRVAKQVGLGVELLEVAADGHSLTETGAIIEFEHRNAPRRVLGQKCGFEVLPCPQIHLLIGHLDPLLRQKHPDPAGIGGTFQLIDLHLTSVDGNTAGRFPSPRGTTAKRRNIGLL